MGKIKILYTIPNFDTAGSGKALLNIAKGLDKHKFEVHIACLHNRGDFFKTVEQSGIPVHILNYTTVMKPYIKGIIKCYQVSKQLKAIGPDIIHSFHYAADYSEALAARIAGIPWIYTKKNMNWGGASKNAWKLRSYMATAIVAQNRDMITTFFSNSKKVTLIPRGVDVHQFKPIEKASHILDFWQLTPKHRIVMCVANLVPVKGIEILLKAFKEVHNNFDEWRLMIVGDHHSLYGQDMQNLTLGLGLKEKVLFCGKQQNIQDYLSLAEVFVLPTLNEGRKEGSPVALLEAMAAGKNVLGSNISGINDQLVDFPSHLIMAGDVFSWKLALEQACNNSKEENRRLGLQFRAHVINQYSIDNEIMLCENLYRQLNNS